MKSRVLFYRFLKLIRQLWGVPLWGEVQLGPGGMEMKDKWINGWGLGQERLVNGQFLVL